MLFVYFEKDGVLDGLRKPKHNYRKHCKINYNSKMNYTISGLKSKTAKKVLYAEFLPALIIPNILLVTNFS